MYHGTPNIRRASRMIVHIQEQLSPLCSNSLRYFRRNAIQSRCSTAFQGRSCLDKLALAKKGDLVDRPVRRVVFGSDGVGGEQLVDYFFNRFCLHRFHLPHFAYFPRYDNVSSLHQHLRLLALITSLSFLRASSCFLARVRASARLCALCVLLLAQRLSRLSSANSSVHQ